MPPSDSPWPGARTPSIYFGRAPLGLHLRAALRVHGPGLRLVGTLPTAHRDRAAAGPPAVARARDAAGELVAAPLTIRTSRRGLLAAILLAGAIIFGAAALAIGRPGPSESGAAQPARSNPDEVSIFVG